MKDHSRCVAEELKVTVTIRKVAAGLLFWRSTDEDLTHATEIAPRLHTAGKQPQSTRRTRGRCCHGEIGPRRCHHPLPVL